MAIALASTIPCAQHNPLAFNYNARAKMRSPALYTYVDRLSMIPQRYSKIGARSCLASPTTTTISSSKHARCFSATKGGGGSDTGGAGSREKQDKKRRATFQEDEPKVKDTSRSNSNNSKSKDNNINNIFQNLSSHEAVWLERQQQHQQYQQRQQNAQPFQQLGQPRFGPKSHFQTASPHKHYGISNTMNLRLIEDSSQVPILIPGKTLNDAGTRPTATATESNNKAQTSPSSNYQRRRRRMLPMVNAAALLDAHKYCKKSAFTTGKVTKSGTEAAKRLLRGKKDLINMLREDIIPHQSRRPFCLTGHGVPKQLLQDHINMGDLMLRQSSEPAEISLSNNTTSIDGFSTEASSPGSMKIRGRDGQSRVWAWPPSPLETIEPQQPGRTAGDIDDHALQGLSQAWSHQLTLYLEVMNRFASKLGRVGLSRLDKESRKYWNVKMYRGMSHPSEVISRPDDEDLSGPVPILEWNTLNRTSDRQPHVSIRLQGTAEGNPGQESLNPVTLVYGACFQEDPRWEPAQPKIA